MVPGAALFLLGFDDVLKVTQPFNSQKKAYVDEPKFHKHRGVLFFFVRRMPVAVLRAAVGI